MTSLYSPKVLAHFKNPKNMGEIKNPDGIAVMGNPVCGDTMKVYIKIATRESKENRENKGNKETYIKDIKFQTLGCAAAIAISSITSQIIKGKSLDQALKVDENTVIKALGGVPKAKIHCSFLAIKAFKKAVENYKSRL